MKFFIFYRFFFIKIYLFTKNIIWNLRDIENFLALSFFIFIFWIFHPKEMYFINLLIDESSWVGIFLVLEIILFFFISSFCFSFSWGLVFSK